MQQRLFQLVERGEFALVDGFEALGVFVQIIESRNQSANLCNGWNWDYKAPER